MIRNLLRTTSFATTCTAVMLLTAVAVVGSSRLANAQAAQGPFCGPYLYPLLSPCSQGNCANPIANCTPDTQVVNGQNTAVCTCEVNAILIPPAAE